jgi:hypothetical protein
MMFLKPLEALTLVLEANNAAVIPPGMSSKIFGLFLAITVGAFLSGRSKTIRGVKGGRNWRTYLAMTMGGGAEGAEIFYLILLILIGIENKQTTTMKGMVGELKEKICTVFIQCFGRLDKAL